MQLWLTPAQAREIVEHARAALPNEACGLIGGTDGIPTSIVPVDNIATDRTSNFEMDPAQQVAATLAFQRNGERLLAIYHSHPTTDPTPSRTDIHQAAYPDAFTLIVSLSRPDPRLAAWHIQHSQVDPVALNVSAAPPSDLSNTEETTELTRAQQAALLIAIIASMLILITYSIYLLPPAPAIPGS